jgi:hypothetical protein
MYFSLEDPESSEHAPDLIKLGEFVVTLAIESSKIHGMVTVEPCLRRWAWTD